jgi:hypothetical protein
MLRVPLNDLGAVVGVPMTVIFLLSRVAVLLVPHVDPEDQRLDKSVSAKRGSISKPSPMFICGIVCLTLGLGIAIVLGLSAGAYRFIGLQSYVAPAVNLGLTALVVATVGIGLVFLDQCMDRHPTRALLRYVRVVELRFFWKILRTPTVLARNCFDM